MLRYIFLILMVFYKCSGDKNVITSKDETVLFRTSEHNLVFSLTIDNDFTYRDSLINRDIILGYSIGKYKKKKDSSIIHLRINNKDTIFKYPLFKVDSILFGLKPNKSFYIRTIHDKNAWIID